MPAERRTFTAARPVKTERTHEENQERAYIAASRRSDRSLEARIESARRASEIHKKRTGRALRVTEQDVINEEMYEEEDDDLPTQYQRLNAHLHTTSVMFNKKLHDYIATQHGVRNMFMSQYQNQGPAFPQYGQQYSPSAANFPQANNWLNPSSMFPPQQFAPVSPGGFQQAQQFSPNPAQPQQGYRQAPYHIPQRTPSHQRALSIQLPQAPSHLDQSTQPTSASTATPQTEHNRRLSLPPQVFQHTNQTAERPTRPSPSQSPTAHSLQQRQSASPQTASPTPLSVTDAQRVPSDTNSPVSYTYSPSNYPYSSQALNTNPLTLSLPPESQQFLGSVLDPNDPRTAAFMAGSENLPQPFTPTYTYNPNKVTRTSNSISDSATGSSQTLSSGLNLKTEIVSGAPSPSLPTSLPDGLYSNDPFLTPGNADYGSFFDFQSGDFAQAFEDHSTNDQDNGNSLVNWD
ncbi:hypothetical protein DDE82_001668 [Stemphylium lycopersici]|uniref:Uncharacterized protein n=1 Tax=Stemphylium lycopersici TaxID=183478 RepID=A0A364NA85_STELY|nr:hypothetical protein TW65_90076 [Stemphylium lycopersici]RAR09552.1 hypothetical protein DDE82_001668 [Stemphylium lycopersici]RAR14238.1 hypothetical protein DDE83_002350 [Stemphylium lycopersici]